ncbi:MAG TPA: hypothetical protein ENI23_05910 [bacterium]|nr:hypothetical protein [bacterium]
MKIFLREAIDMDFSDLGEFLSVVTWNTILNARLPFARDVITIEEGGSIAKELIAKNTNPTEAFKSKDFYAQLLKYLEKAHKELDIKRCDRLISRRMESHEEFPAFKELLGSKDTFLAEDIDGLVRSSPLKTVNINLAKLLMAYYLNREGLFKDQRWYPFVKRLMADLIQRAFIYSKARAPWPEHSGPNSSVGSKDENLYQ